MGSVTTTLVIVLVTLPVCIRGDGLDAIKGLVYRLLGDQYVTQFHYELIPQEDGKDVFEIDTIKQEKSFPVSEENLSARPIS